MKDDQFRKKLGYSFEKVTSVESFFEPSKLEKKILFTFKKI